MSVQPKGLAIAGGRPEALPSPNVAQESALKHVVYDVPSANFMLAHRATEWVLNEDGDLLPVICHLSKSPGVQGVGRRGEFGEARAWYEDNGLTLIPHNILPQDYVRLYKNEKGKKVHRSVFQAPINTADKTTVWRHDGNAWTKFLRLLRVRGIVAPPQPTVIEQMLRIKRMAYEAMTVPDHADRSKRARYERHSKMMERQIQTLEIELESSFEHYGRPASEVMSEVEALLDAALEGFETDGPMALTAHGKQPPKVITPPAPKLPKVMNLAAHLAGLDREFDVLALQSRDSRPTADPLYEARLAELRAASGQLGGEPVDNSGGGEPASEDGLPAIEDDGIDA